MKDTREIPRAGDKAIIVGAHNTTPSARIWSDAYNNKTVDVISDPYGCDCSEPDCAMTFNKVIVCCDGMHLDVKTTRLLRIPPDSECKTLFTDTQDKRKVGA